MDKLMMTVKFSKIYRIWVQTRQQTWFKSVRENKVKVHLNILKSLQDFSPKSC